MARKADHWTAAAQIDLVPLEPGRLYMFRSTLTSAAGYSDRYAYFLIRPGGNCLFHGPRPAVFYEQQRGFFDAHGGIALQVCSHGDDVPDAWELVEKTWGAALYLNRWDVRGMKQLHGTLEGFVEGVAPGPDLEAIHTPGHTLGFHSFRWSGAAGTYLFASHLIEPRARSWVFPLHPLLKDAGLRTLEKLRGLDVDVLLPLRTQGKGDPAGGPRAPLPFGTEIRERAVDQATREVRRKLRRHEAKATGKAGR